MMNPNIHDVASRECLWNVVQRTFSSDELYSYETVVVRWPVILTNIIDTIYRVDHELSLTLACDDGDANAPEISEKIEEGKSIIEKIGKVKYEMARDRPLQ